jgi:hypothetical protein
MAYAFLRSFAGSYLSSNVVDEIPASRPRAVGGAPCADHVVGRSPAPVLT